MRIKGLHTKKQPCCNEVGRCYKSEMEKIKNNRYTLEKYPSNLGHEKICQHFYCHSGERCLF